MGVGVRGHCTVTIRSAFLPIMLSSTLVCIVRLSHYGMGGGEGKEIWGRGGGERERGGRGERGGKEEK